MDVPPSPASRATGITAAPAQNTLASLAHPHQNMKPLFALIVLVPIAALSFLVVCYWLRRGRGREQINLQRTEALNTQILTEDKDAIDENLNLSHPEALDAFGSRAITIQSLEFNLNNAGERMLDVRKWINLIICLWIGQNLSSGAAVTARSSTIASDGDTTITRDRVVSMPVREDTDLRAQIANSPVMNRQSTIPGMDNRSYSFESMSILVPPTYREQ